MKKRYAWLTDIHLNSCDDLGASLRSIAEEFDARNVNGAIISGDISLSTTFVNHMSALSDAIGARPIYFVLGNHDVWFNSRDGARSIARSMSDDRPNVVYVPSKEYIELNDGVCLIGHDGWYDFVNGRYVARLMMNDWTRIEDFSRLTSNRMQSIIDLSRHESQKMSNEVLRKGMEAAKKYKKVIIVTHVPPSSDMEMGWDRIEKLPMYSSAYMESAVRELAKKNPNNRFVVLCGHTHMKSSKKIEPNLTVHVGEASYGDPRVQQVFTL